MDFDSTMMYKLSRTQFHDKYKSTYLPKLKVQQNDLISINIRISIILNKLSSKIGNQNFIQFDLLLCSVSFLKAIHKEVTFVFMASLLLLESIKVK